MRFDPQRSLALAAEFDEPRLARTEGEQRAAERLAAHLTEAGWEVERRDVTPTRFPVLLILGTLLAWFFLATFRLLPHAVIEARAYATIFAFGLFLAAVFRGVNQLQAAGRTHPAQHILAARPGAPATVRVVLATPLASGAARWCEHLLWLLLAVFLALGVFGLTPWAGRAARATAWVGPGVLVAWWGSLLLLFVAPKSVPAPPGPSDNRSGLGVLLELARCWPGADRVELRLAATSNLADLGRIARRDWPDLPTTIVWLDRPGLGDRLELVVPSAMGELVSAARDLWLPYQESRGSYFRLLTRSLRRAALPVARIAGRGRSGEIDPSLLAATAQLAREFALRWGRKHANAGASPV